jgi:serine-type D-Ala-D-Ala carboxypeptidase (penicillin-binding protein 5/6)
MKRSTLLICLSLFFGLTAVLVTGWIVLALAGSRPLVTQSVLGATTPQAELVPRPYPERSGTVPAFANARRFVLYNPESGKVLAGSNETEVVPVASTTKMMTAHVITQIGALDDVVTLSRESAIKPGSTMSLRPGERITVENLLKGALLVSGNDAATALAEYGGKLLLQDPSAPHQRAVERFVEEMNSQAKLIGMTETRYLDPAGLNDEGRSTALDLAKLTHLTLANKKITDILLISHDTVFNIEGTIRHELRNSNRLVADYNYDGIIGGKTGFTHGAGHCLLSAAKRGDMTLVAVVLSTYQETRDASALETRRLLDWGFANWQLR